jgi:hypothetical protein
VKTKYFRMFKGLDLGLGTIVSSAHGGKRCKTVCWERLGLELNNMVVFRKNKRPYLFNNNHSIYRQKFCHAMSVHNNMLCSVTKSLINILAAIFSIFIFWDYPMFERLSHHLLLNCKKNERKNVLKGSKFYFVKICFFVKKCFFCY